MTGHKLLPQKICDHIKTTEFSKPSKGRVSSCKKPEHVKTRQNKNLSPSQPKSGLCLKVVRQTYEGNEKS